MVVITTIYCMELDAAGELTVETPAEERVVDPSDVGRELLSIYQGKNREIPMDSER